MKRQDIIAVVEALLEKARVRMPPVDLDSISRVQGVTRVERVRMGSVLGMTTQLSSGFSIKLNSRVPMKERFTYAHEIAHTLLTPPNWQSGGVHRRTRTTGSSLERLCDEIAAELLMPHTWVLPVIRGGRIGAKSVLKVAGTFDTSLNAAAIRVAELSKCNVGISCWRVSTEASSMIWDVGDRDLLSHIPSLLGRDHGSRSDPVSHALRCGHSVVWQASALGQESRLLFEFRGLGKKPARRLLVLVRAGFSDGEFSFLQGALHRSCRYESSAAQVA